MNRNMLVQCKHQLPEQQFKSSILGQHRYSTENYESIRSQSQVLAKASMSRTLLFRFNRLRHEQNAAHEILVIGAQFDHVHINRNRRFLMVARVSITQERAVR